MKKYILILLTSVVTLSSCSDWFDVTSGSEIREKDHYSTLAGFQQSLIGCYNYILIYVNYNSFDEFYYL